MGCRWAALTVVVAAVAVAVVTSDVSVARATITAEVSFTPDRIALSGVSTLRVVVHNTDPEPATAAGATHSLPAGLVVAPWPNLANSCGGAIVLTPGGNTVQIIDGTIPAATAEGPGTCAISFDVVSGSVATFTFTLAAGQLTTSRGALSASASATLETFTFFPISGDKDFSPGLVHGDPTSEAGASTVTIMLRNPNFFSLTGVGFTDTLPPGLQLARPPNAFTTCGGSLNNPQPLATSITLSNGFIPAFGDCRVSFEVFISRDTANTFHDETLVNVIPGGAINTNQGIGNSSILGSLHIQTGAKVVKTFDPSTVFSGEAPRLRLEFRNYNKSPLTAISLTDNLPSPMKVANPVNPITTCPTGTINASPGNANFSFTNGQVPGAPAGHDFSSCTAAISVTAANTTTSPNVLVNTTDPNVFNGVQVGSASASLTVLPVTNITAQKEFAGVAVQTGVVTLTITVKNKSLFSANNLTLTDNLTTMGSGYTVAASPPPATTCNGLLIAPSGSTTIALTNGRIPPGGTCTVTVPVRIAGTAALGTRTNTIPAGAIQTDVGNTVTDVTASITTAAALEVAKAFAPDTVVAGQDARLSITVSHTDGAAPFTNLSFVDTLPAGHVVSTTPAVANSCGGTVTAVPGAGTITLAGGQLGAGATACVVEVDVTTPGTAGSATNTLPPGQVTTLQGATNGTAASATLVRIVTAVSLTKALAPDAISTGDTSVLSLTLANTDASAIALSDGTLIDTQPLGLVVADPPNATLSGAGCAGTVNAVPGGQIVALSGASLGVGSVCLVQVNLTTATPGSFTNRINPGAFRSSQGVTNETAAEATLTATGNADLSVIKTAEATTATPGATFSYVVTVRNLGPNDVAGAVFTDNAPAGAPFISWTCTPSSGALCTAAGTGSLLDTVTIPANGSLQYFVTANVVPGATGSLVNTASIAAPDDVTDANPANNTATLSLPLVPATALGLFKTNESEVATPGGSNTYSVTVTNLGPSDATNVSVHDLLPSGVTLAANVTCQPVGSATCGVVSGAAGAGEFDVTGTRIPAGAGNAIVVLVPVDYAPDLAGPVLVNTASAFDAVSGGTAIGSDTDTVLPVVNLAVAVQVPATYTPGGTDTYAITVTNGGPSDSLVLGVGSVLPAGVTLAGPVACLPAGEAVCGVITAADAISVMDPTSFTMAGAQLAAGAGHSLVLTMPVRFAGNLTTNPLVFAATATDTTTGASASGSASSAPSVNVVLTIAKSDGASAYVAGGQGAYTIEVGNSGLSDALGVTLVDALPAGVTLTGPPTCTVAGNASCGTVTGLAGGTTFGTTGARVGGGGGHALTFVAPVAFASNLLTDPLLNTATVSDAPSGSTAAATDSNARSVNVVLTVSKTDGSATYTPGGQGVYTIVVRNAGVSDALVVSVADTLPAGVTLRGPATCTPAGTAVCGVVAGLPGGSTINVFGARVPSGAGNTLTFVAPVAFAPGLLANPLVNTVTVSDLSSGGTASATDSNVRVANVALTISKTDGSATYTPGGQGVYTIVVANTGLSNATGVTLVDALPAGVTLSGPVTCTPAGSATCGTVTGVAGGTTFGTTGAQVPGGGADTLTFAAPVAFASGLAANPLVNTATVSDVPSGSTASASDSSTRVASVVMTVSKTDGATTYRPGGQGVYTVVVGNSGLSDATGVSVADTLPPGVTLAGPVTCTPAGNASCGTRSGLPRSSTFGATAARIGGGAGNTLTFTAPVVFGSGLQTDPLVNTVTASHVPSGSTASASDSNTRALDVVLTIGKTDGVTTYTPGGQGVYTIVVGNTGVSDALVVTVTDTLPAGVTLTGPVTCNASGNASCGAVTGAAGGSAFGATGARVGGGPSNGLTFTVPVAFASSLLTNPLVNTASASDLPSGSSASASDSNSRVGGVVALTLSKTDGVSTYTPGGSGVYSIVVGNTGPSDALGVTLVDTLPAGVTLTGPVTCTPAGSASCGTVTGVAGGSTFGTTGAQIGAGAGNTLTFTAPVAFAAGLSTNPLVNTATVSDAPSGSTASATDSNARAGNAALTLSKTDGVSTYQPGGQGVYTIVVGNTGTANALNVTLVDTLPAGVTLSGPVTCTAAGSASCGTVTGVAGGSTFGTTGAQVGAGAGNTLTFVAPVAFAPGLLTDPLVNTATVSDAASGIVTSASDSNERAGATAIPVTSPLGLALLVLLFLLVGLARMRGRAR